MFPTFLEICGYILGGLAISGVISLVVAQFFRINPRDDEP